MLQVLREKLRKAIKDLLGKAVIDEKVVKDVLKEIQKGLILSDVNVKVVLDFTRKVETKVLSSEPPPGVSLRDYIIKTIYDELTNILGKEKAELLPSKSGVYKILLIGIEGCGKTTTAAKLAKYYRDLGYKVGVLSIDTYRPAARDQLRQLVKDLDIEFFDMNTNDPFTLALEGLKHLRNKGCNIVIIDTAGRHKDERSLMQELKEIKEIIKPDFTFLVIDASIGQQAYSQAKAFNETVEVGGLIITKMDGTAKGGGALSAAAATGAKVYFIGTGEKVKDFEEYNPKGFVGRLLGLGDLEGLLRKFRAIEISEEKRKKLEMIAKGRFTLADMIDQLEEVRKLGSLSKLLDLLPGFSLKIPRDLISQVEEKIEKWKIALNSMTVEEKIDPTIIKGSRLRRISRGSGVDEQTIKEMIKQYIMLKRFMKSRQSKRLIRMMGKGLIGKVKYEGL